jgi:hypothetical protein
LRATWAVTCRYAESDGNVGTIIGAGIDVLYVPDFPHQVGLMLAVRLAATLEEVAEGQQHELIARVLAPNGGLVRAPDGSEAPPLGVTFQATAAQQLVPGWLVTPLFALGLQWWAAEEGTYTIEVSAADAEPSSSPVHVLKAPASP